MTTQTLKGGDKFEKAMAQLATKLGQPKTLQVGFFANAKYEDGTPVAMVAAIQNFGAPKAGIPPRPFFTNMITDNSAKWPRGIAQALKDNDDDVDTALAITGEVMVGQLKKSINDLTSPPLSQVTLMLRKMKKENPSLKITGATVGEAARRVAAGESTEGISTKPLIYTAQLINSATYQIKQS